MLKFIYLKNQKIPVPVPVRSLADAVRWVSETFCSEGQIITKLNLDGFEIDLDGLTVASDHEIDANSELKFQIDEPRDLSVQSLEAVKDFAIVVLPQIRQLAIELYKGPNPEVIAEFDEIMTDLDFIFDLKFHINGILDQYHEALAPFEGLAYLAEIVKRDLSKFYGKKMWSDAAVTILGRLCPFLKELVKEIETLQLRVGEDSSVILTQAG